MSQSLRARRGFTLIELLIVIVVIAILALIVIPRLMGAGRKAKEATLKANLHQLRNALEQFQSDTGVYPAALDDVVATTAPTTGAGGATIPAGTYQGPYMPPKGGINNTGLPANPFTGQSDTTVANHWKYTAADGTVTVPDGMATNTTLDGVAYSSL